MSSAKADRSRPDKEPIGWLIAAVVASLIVTVFLMRSSNTVLSLVSGVVYLVGMLLLFMPDVAGIASPRAGRTLGAAVVLASLVLLVLAHGNGG